MPQIPGWEFAACWQPARVVSGDFYDLIPISHGELKFVIADVTDKGMPAALFMALTRTIVRASCETLESLAEVITKTNQLICNDTALAMPVTLFAGRLNINTGQMIYVNAGQNPPMYYKAEEGKFVNLTRTGMFLGFEEKAEFQQKSIFLKPGDLLICYTDGVLDAVDDQWEAFEMERFQTVVDKNVSASPKELLEAIEEAVCEFIGDVLPYDDITMLIIKRLGAE
jgi:sigma-B regulation protein RsbU (phosphoserine phosphatase)